MRPNQQSGLSLVEIVVAVLLLTAAGGALFYLASTSVRANTTSKDHAAAMHLAVAKIEELKNEAFDALASGADPGPISAGGASGGIFSRTWSVASRTVAGVPSKDVTVTVAWTGGRSLTLTTNVVQPTTIVPTYMEAFPTVFVGSWNQTR